MATALSHTTAGAPGEEVPGWDRSHPSTSSEVPEPWTFMLLSTSSRSVALTVAPPVRFSTGWVSVPSRRTRSRTTSAVLPCTSRPRFSARIVRSASRTSALSTRSPAWKPARVSTVSPPPGAQVPAPNPPSRSTVRERGFGRATVPSAT